MTGIGSIFGLHFHKGPIRNVQDLDAREKGRERELGALKKLFQLDMFERGIYATRRIMGNLSLATTAAEIDMFIEALDEFFTNRGNLIRTVVN
jgi:glutamate-1-semialdehyde aminotransferase